MSHIRVTIDCLTLRGIDQQADRTALIDALRTELARGLGSASSPAHTQRAAVLTLAPIPLEPGARGGQRFGARMANAIVKGVRP